MKKTVLVAEYAKQRPAEIIVDAPLPLEEAVCLQFSGKEYNFTPQQPIYGFFRRGREVIAVTLEEDQQRLSKTNKIGDHVEDSILYIWRINQNDSPRRIGFIRMKEIGPPTSRIMFFNGKINSERRRNIDLEDLINAKEPLATAIDNRAIDIACYRYSIEDTQVHPSSRYEKIKSHTTLKLEQQRGAQRREIKGYVKHDSVKRFKLPKGPLTEELILILPEGNSVVLKTSLDLFGHQYPTPIIGAYTHPYDNNKVVLARLLERGNEQAARNRIIVTELGEKEQEVGYLYFRVLPEEILADGFYIGEGSTRMIDQVEAAKLRRRGLGSRVLETAEEIFKQRYGSSTVYFESEIDFQKVGVQNNRGNFFKDNGYRRIYREQDINRDLAALFAKEI